MGLDNLGVDPQQQKPYRSPDPLMPGGKRAIVSVEDVKSAPVLRDMIAGKLAPGRISFDTAANLTVSHAILPGSPHRRALHFVGPNTGRVTLSNNPSVVLDNGITLSGTAGIFTLIAEQVGDCVTQEWYAIYPAGATPVSWIEVMNPDAL